MSLINARPPTSSDSEDEYDEYDGFSFGYEFDVSQNMFLILHVVLISILNIEETTKTKGASAMVIKATKRGR